MLLCVTNYRLHYHYELKSFLCKVLNWFYLIQIGLHCVVIFCKLHIFCISEGFQTNLLVINILWLSEVRKKL